MFAGIKTEVCITHHLNCGSYTERDLNYRGTVVGVIVLRDTGVSYNNILLIGGINAPAYTF